VAPADCSDMIVEMSTNQCAIVYENGIGLVMRSPDDIDKYLPVIISFLSSCMHLLFWFVSLSYSIVVYLALYIAGSYPC